MKFKNFFILLGITILLFFVISGAKMSYLSIQVNHKIEGQSIPPISLYRVLLKDFMVQMTTPITASRDVGLPEIRLYLPQKAQNSLMSDPPSSTKKWKKALMIYPDGKLRPIKTRIRGDNPINWAFDKKSWRIKLRKKNLINNVRSFDYVLPNELYFAGNYLSYSLGRKAGLLAPRSRLVELFINEKSRGIYLEVERLDESFLRNNGTMPVNLYKGEQIHGDQSLFTDIALLGNPGLWKKISTFNQLPEEDFSDLAFFLDLIRRAINSEEDFDRLKSVARFSDWARFAAFQALVQGWSNERKHNLRLVYDPWRGSVKPVVHDTQGFKAGDRLSEPRLNVDTHSLLTLYHTSSEFLQEKYQFLYDFLVTGLLLQGIDDINSIYPLLKRSFSRDPFRYQESYANNMAEQTPVSQNDLDILWKSLLNYMRGIQKNFLNQLSEKPSFQWIQQKGRIGFVIDGPIPVDRVTISFTDDSTAPEIIKWDADGNGKNSPADIAIPFRREDNQIHIDATWIANHVASSSPSPYTYDFTESQFEIKPTQFWLIMDQQISPDFIIAANALTGKSFKVEKGSNLGGTPSRWNKPVFHESEMTPETWEGELEVEGTRILEKPVRILAGTTLKMGSGASLIFKNKLQVEGTNNAPVKVIPASPEIAWGAFVLHGQKTANSTLSYLMAEGGSGRILESARYIAMLSIHETQNVEFRNLTLKNNSAFDDMMHVVYSKNIRMHNCLFENAFSDSLDVDFSEISINGCRINYSGNDGIDLMSSKALVQASNIQSSGDKGISVGERSEVLIFNTQLINNKIGVESKEASISYIVNSDLINNEMQISAYKKNWRYHLGGTVLAEKTIFQSSRNSFEADKNSEIKIFDSSFFPEIPKKSRGVTWDKLSKKSKQRKSTSAILNPTIAAIIKNQSLQINAGIRGVIQ